MKTLRECLQEIFEHIPNARLFDGEDEYEKAEAYDKLHDSLSEEAAIVWWTEEYTEEYGVAGNLLINGKVEFNIFPDLELYRIDFH
jgi:hypothetical protein